MTRFFVVLTPFLYPTYLVLRYVPFQDGWPQEPHRSQRWMMDLPPILHPKYCTQWGTPGNLVASRAKIVTLNLCTSQVPPNVGSGLGSSLSRTGGECLGMI